MGEGPAAELTEAELAVHKVLAQNATHPASWQWNEAAISFVAPSSPPADGNPYIWNEATTAWVAFPG